MKHLSLAARYRPQTFAQVAGQELVVAALSRAAERDSPAPAYLLSGTRGVGKTTIARIFAKALNCEHAPCAEPCNECAQCRKIAAGSHVDVTEIDGASNNGVEDARALREHIGYAPMDGRYKVFIIDEAHMLSKSAFNALLKTLEEPPERVVFIFATTEAHKFPITIISRCQHFVFRHLSEDALAEHLTRTLHAEKQEYEDAAVRLIARRAAGSVRDAMSLLDQTLALGGARLNAETTRQVLGLAGQEFFNQLLTAFSEQDCAQASAISRELLRQGVDIGFFLRELATLWRNLFLLRETNGVALAALNLPDDESSWLASMAKGFSVPHLHAAWQMTLDAQRGITQSPEPASALELLILNLALLPKLLPLENLDKLSPPEASPGAASEGDGQPELPRTAARSSSLARSQERQACPPPSPKAQEAPARARASAQAVAPEAVSEQPSSLAGPGFQPDWASFCAFCASEQKAGRLSLPLNAMRGLKTEWLPDTLRILASSQEQLRQLDKQRHALQSALAAYCKGQAPTLDLASPAPMRSQQELKDQFSKHPELQNCFEILGAKVASCVEESKSGPRNSNHK